MFVQFIICVKANFLLKLMFRLFPFWPVETPDDASNYKHTEDD